MIRIAPEGRPFILGAWGIAIGLVLVFPWYLFVPGLLVAIWVTAFFRDPDRTGLPNPEHILAPADGKVISIVPLHEPDFLDGPSVRISIFMNVFNVHVNRYPTDGTLTYRQYHPGRFFNAAADKASHENEQSSVGLLTPNGKILIRQIAGWVARRIVTDHEVDTTVHQGERLGLIRFGSRVDLFLPPEASVRVALGDHTVAGITSIGTWHDPAT